MLPNAGYVTGNGLRLRYVEWQATNAAGTTLPLVGLHGIGGSANDWGSLARALEGSRRVIALDARGHGGSEWSAEAAYSTDHHFADVAGALDELGIDECVLAGYSMGGGVAILSAHALAERVTQLIVVDAYPGPEMTEGSRRIARFIARGPWLEAGRPRFDPAISAAFARDLQSGTPRRMDLWPHWDALECPTLVVRGEQSRVLPEPTARAMEARQPRARTATIAGATHNLLFEHPDPLGAEVRSFLQGVA